MVLQDDVFLHSIQDFCKLVIECYQNNGKILLCGNGGSAADAQHIAAEWQGRYLLDRKPLHAEALHANTSYITAVANDYGFEESSCAFSRAFVDGRNGRECNRWTNIHVTSRQLYLYDQRSIFFVFL